MEAPLALWCAAASALLLVLMGFDKGRAQKGGRRVSETTLFAWALLGGAPGGTLGMFLFRHKTRHWSFRLAFPLLCLCQLGGLVRLCFF